MKILVTGPQRSGTTFISNCIARDMNLTHIDEAEFQVSDLEKFIEVTGKEKNWVAQGPGIMMHLFQIQNIYPEITFIIIKRDVSEIIKSQERISWQYENYEKENLGFSNDLRDISIIKYDLWDSWKKNFNHYIEYEYEDFKNHPYWVEKEKRSSFHSKQWSP
jgi:adenylate kinase family enzyme